MANLIDNLFVTMGDGQPTFTYCIVEHKPMTFVPGVTFLYFITRALAVVTQAHKNGCTKLFVDCPDLIARVREFALRCSNAYSRATIAVDQGEVRHSISEFAMEISAADIRDVKEFISKYETLSYELQEMPAETVADILDYPVTLYNPQLEIQQASRFGREFRNVSGTIVYEMSEYQSKLFRDWLATQKAEEQAWSHEPTSFEP